MKLLHMAVFAAIAAAAGGCASMDKFLGRDPDSVAAADAKKQEKTDNPVERPGQLTRGNLNDVEAAEYRKMLDSDVYKSNRSEDSKARSKKTHDWVFSR